MPGLEHNLFHFSKIVGWIYIKLHRAQYLERCQLFWKDLRWVKHVKPKGLGLAFVYNLDSEVPLRSISRRDRIPEVETVEVGILSIQNLSLFPEKACLPLL